MANVEPLGRGCAWPSTPRPSTNRCATSCRSPVSEIRVGAWKGALTFIRRGCWSQKTGSRSCASASGGTSAMFGHIDVPVDFAFGDVGLAELVIAGRSGTFRSVASENASYIVARALAYREREHSCMSEGPPRHSPPPPCGRPRVRPWLTRTENSLPVLPGPPNHFPPPWTIFRGGFLISY